MRFLVYEKDPLVRDDILETLKDAFSGVVHLIEDLRDLGRCNERYRTPAVVILSVSDQNTFEKNAHALLLPARAGVVKICDDPPIEAEARATTHFVPRPFNTCALVSAVKNALSSQLTDPS
tara:strand:- start:1045 stop:1407 length:363 start_codon:yes stop_codon:yes gene_type:complete